MYHIMVGIHFSHTHTHTHVSCSCTIEAADKASKEKQAEEKKQAGNSCLMIC